jgi:hypothetical protein
MPDDKVTQLPRGAQPTTRVVVERSINEMKVLGIFAIRENDIETAIQALVCVQHMNLLLDKLSEFCLEDEPWCGIEGS